MAPWPWDRAYPKGGACQGQIETWQLTNPDHTIREGNSVISDPAVHAKAFDWQAAFPEVFARGSVPNVAPAVCWAGDDQHGSSEASQSLTHTLPHPVPELPRTEHLDVRHPGENPPRQFLATGGLQAELDGAVPALPQLLARGSPKRVVRDD